MKTPSRLVVEESELDSELPKLLNEKIISNEGLDCNELKKYDFKLYEKLIDDPEVFIEKTEEYVKDFGITKIKVNHLDEEKEISRIREGDIGKLQAIKGIIKRITKVLSRTKKISFECPSCGSIIKIIQKGKKTSKPNKCSCGNRTSFREVEEERTNMQELVLEELPEDCAGKQPQQLRVYLEGSLCNPDFSEKLQPGKRVKITGVIKKLPRFMTRNDRDENISEFITNAVGINNLEEEKSLELEEEEMREIKEIAVDNPLKKLSESLAPSIYGYEVIKKAIILHMVKGNWDTKKDGSIKRGEIHILLTGDPGTSKTQLLKAAQRRTPKSTYLVGTKSSAVGLTAATVRDEMSGKWSLEAGALVLVNGSSLFLDELDKLQENHQEKLLEPMSNGSVIIQKAGINAELRARTGILGAANPSEGRYNRSQPVVAQINMRPELLNRFDLIFTMIDVQKDKQDRKLVSHMLRTNNSQEKIPPLFFKKFINYVRKLEPKFPEESTERFRKIEKKLSDIYLKYRKLSNTEGENQGIPINPRHLEALKRLSTAHAKLRLSDEVEVEDIDVAEEIFKYSLSQVGITETGQVDISRIDHVVPTSERGKLNKIMEIMVDLRERLGELIPYEEISKKAGKYDIKKWQLDSYLQKLREEGQIIKPQNNFYQIL